MVTTIGLKLSRWGLMPQNGATHNISTCDVASQYQPFKDGQAAKAA